jgi:hypothetical protein
MKKEYDFSKGVRGAVIPMPKSQVRVTMRIDRKTLNWFRAQVEKAHGGDCFSMMNNVLRAHVDSKGDRAEAMFRKVLREELAGYSVRKKKTRSRA